MENSLGSGPRTVGLSGGQSGPIRMGCCMDLLAQTSPLGTHYTTRTLHMSIPSILETAHRLAGRAVSKGGLAIDATVGNGHDTLFLARTVGAEGRVVGFDIQRAALKETRRRVGAEAPDVSLTLVQAGHETMAEHLPTRDAGEVEAVMFNLGYLPGGDHSVTTEPETTCRALDASLNLLRPGGVVTVVAYPGHEGGKKETQAVESWVSTRPEDCYQAVTYQLTNQPNDPPRLYAVEKLPE